MEKLGCEIIALFETKVKVGGKRTTTKKKSIRSK